MADLSGDNLEEAAGNADKFDRRWTGDGTDG